MTRFGRLIVWAATLAFALGALPHGVQAARMDFAMIAAAAGSLPMPDDCGGCDDSDDGKADGKCLSFCTAMTALLPSAPVLKVTVRESLKQPVAPGMLGLRGPPDPYPPRFSS